ncbi:hypothetical protein KEM55_006225, partial [Ascosphaera atra]
AGFSIDDQFYFGSYGLLVKPVTQEGATSAEVYIADGAKYYDYYDYTIYQGAGKKHTVDAPLEKVPVLMQGGHIIPRKDRPRRSSGLMKYDPYTLVVVLDENGQAQGTLYEDDGETYDYESGAYIHRQFKFADSVLSSEDLGVKGSKTEDYLKATEKVTVEKVIVVGAPASWKGKDHVSVRQGPDAEPTRADMVFHAAEGKKAAYAVVKNPKVPMGQSWAIEF